MSSASNIRAVVDRLLAARVKLPANLARGLATIERAPEREHERLAAALAERVPAIAPLVSRIEVLSPAYPSAPRAIQARLALGKKPARIMRGLSPRDAHEALLAGVSDPCAWLLRDVPAHGIDDVDVARWIVACWRDPARRAAIETERTERIAGAEVRGRLLDRIDEIRACDLARGEKTGVRDAFESAARRAYAEWERGAEHDDTSLASTPRWWRPLRCARLLMSAKALCAEGREMKHCVGTYAPFVRQERSIIVSIAVRARGEVYRSTAEISRETREVRQHKGIGNASPPTICERALRVLIDRTVPRRT